MYNLFIATPEKVVYEGEVISLIAPGTLGFFEILTNHAPIISTLKPGPLVVTNKDHQKMTWKLTEGYLEAINNQVTLLADKCEE